MSPEFKENEASIGLENMRRAATIAVSADWSPETEKEFIEVCRYETRRAQSLSYFDLLTRKAKAKNA